MSNDYIQYNYYAELMNRIGGWLLKHKKQYKTRDAYGYFGKVSKKEALEKIILERYNNGEYSSDGLGAEYCECIIFDNAKDLSFLPNYVTGKDGRRWYKNEYVDFANRTSSYEGLHGASPKIIYIKPQTSTSTTYDYFISKFGTLTDFDSFLQKIRGRGYSYYYNSAYSNKTTIDRIYNKQGVNCTDSAQLGYRIAEKLGYEVHFLHIRCKKSGGHIRLKLRHKTNTGNQWIMRDPASVLNGSAITSNWCTDGTLIATDPKWIFDDLEA